MPSAPVYVLAVFAILSQLADLVTSLLGFRRGAVEMNPIGQTPLSLIALKLLAIAVIVAVLYLSGRLRTRWGFRLVAVGMAAVSTLPLMAAWHNLGI